MGRRAFLVGAGALTASALALRGGVFVAGNGNVRLDPRVRGDYQSTTRVSADATRHWLGPELWGNRLQDWRRHNGRIECLAAEAGDEVRTVALLTREIVAGDTPGHIRLRAGVAGGPERTGFCGLLLGVGDDDLDYRAAALAQRGSGTGGGLLCTFGTDGRIRFREHTDEARPLAFEELDAETHVASSSPHRPREDGPVDIVLDIVPRGNGRFDVRLAAVDPESGVEVASGVRRDIPGSAVKGGLALVSSPPPGEPGARWWFDDIEIAGEKIPRYPDRSLDPILGTLFSLSDDTLKLTAQLLPVGPTDGRPVRLQYRPASGRNADGDWQNGPRAAIEDGYVARFRVDDWNTDRAWEYRVVYNGRRRWTYNGRIPREPADDESLDIGLFSCTKVTARPLEAERASGTLSGTAPPGRFTSENIFFPHDEVVANTSTHDPDLLVFAGDQIYEENPTRTGERTEPGLDYLYKWYLWLWAFRELTRDRPSLVLVDDHDVYQANIWGARGAAAPGGRVDEGGYVGTPQFVNRAQRIQCSHNPDPVDPRPVERGVDVYFTGFAYGGVRFALLEDRKFKSPKPGAQAGADPPRLLGARQLAFLREWAETDEDAPHVCLTQTTFACAHTTPGGEPALDYDANGYPKAGRDRAVAALREAGALVLSGDQHLGTLLRHGLDSYDDGVIQFTGPQTGATFQRWFEPGDLPNDAGAPHTGEFMDAFGNPFRMLAVANPPLSFAEYREHQPTGQVLPEREHRADGYGLVRVDPDAGAYEIECWPWDADPADGDAQYDGWPYRLAFDATDGRDAG